MPFESVDSPDVALHRLHALVPGHLHHSQHVCPRCRGAGQQPGPEGVPGEGGRIEPCLVFIAS